ncbi:RloB family protein [Levilinea saccharolytica]|uniref:Abortive phage resistance protein n=1 Tax=Levilinea saccharolytica TaxID=229921 RepID=A0A0N8GT19_9CHLR|nr:RloB family protein [Levilinea saccharolytica]KPL90866.1 hypothetical protein ADN01_02090 [Levilinea saccharolytica]GAP18978.1 RloB-like protein [Levilinea saccharolytica]
MKSSKSQFTPRKRAYMQRRLDQFDVRQRFLIVCEGTRTEPQYFERFRVPGLVVRVEGVGMNTLRLVDEAINCCDEGDYDQVWCVFDKDDFPIENFENAIQRARERNMHVAYSNQAFELWYVLHFEYLNSAIDRKAYMEKLTQYLGFKYKKNDPDIYQVLQCKMDTAIRNAERLMQEYRPSRPGRDDPSTTVYQLVIALREQAKPLSCV